MISLIYVSGVYQIFMPADPAGQAFAELSEAASGYVSCGGEAASAALAASSIADMTSRIAVW